MTSPSTIASLPAAPIPDAQEPQPGDILLFFLPHRKRDYLIKWVTRSRFYHAGIYAGGNRLIESRPKGVIDNDLCGREKAFVTLPAPDGKGEAALAWAKTQMGSPYDDRDVLVIFLEHVFTHWHINYNPLGKYTCGEFIAAAFQKAGVTLVPGMEVSSVSPGDIAHLLPKDEQKAKKAK